MYFLFWLLNMPLTFSGDVIDKPTILKSKIAMDSCAVNCYYTALFCIVEHKGLLYLPDYNSNRILVLNKDFKLLQTIGREGDGPGELRGPLELTINNDMLFCHNQSSLKLTIFDLKGKYLETVMLPDIMLATSFAADSRNYLFFSSHNKTKLLASYSLDGVIQDHFGEMFNDKVKKTGANISHVLLAKIQNQETLVAVSQHEPFIDLYSPEGKFYLRKNLNTLRPLKEHLNFVNDWRGKHPNDSGIHIIFMDAFVQNNDLYVLLYDVKQADTILKFALSKQAVTYQGRFLLRDKKMNPINATAILKSPTHGWLAFDGSNSELHVLAPF